MVLVNECLRDIVCDFDMKFVVVCMSCVCVLKRLWEILVGFGEDEWFFVDFG